MVTSKPRHRFLTAISLLLVVLSAYDTAAAPITRSVVGIRESRVGQQFWLAQLPPDAGELERYTGLHAAAAKGDVGSIKRRISAGANLESQDRHGRTPLMVASYKRNHAAARALIEAGANLGALDSLSGAESSSPFMTRTRKRRSWRSSSG